MNLHIVKTIFLKELKDTIRDSKTLVVMILLPIILYPLLAIGGGQVLMQQGKKIQNNVIIISLNKTDNGLCDFLKQDKKIKIVEHNDPLKYLKIGNINAYIKITDKFKQDIDKEKVSSVEVLFDQASIESLHARSEITNLLDDYSLKVIESRISKKGLNKNILIPFNSSFKNIAPKEKIGGFYLGNILPFIIIFMTILGAFYPAIDQTAGEKERGTLETLLTTPVKKYEIITGKFLTISLFAFITGLLNLASMTLSMTMLLGSDKINFTIPWSAMGLIFLVLIPVTMFFVAIMMLVSSLANSFKDAQNYLTPVYLICGFPAMVTIVPGFNLNFKSSLIPVANVSLLIKDLLLGKFEIDLIILVIVSTTIYSMIAIAAATRLFNREDVLLSEESNLRLLFTNNSSKLKRTPNFIESITLYIIGFGLLFYVGGTLQTMYKLNGVLMTEVFLVFLPTILFVKYLKFDYRETLSLRKVSLKSLVGSTLLAISGGFFIAKFAREIQEKIFPMPSELKEAFKYLLYENGHLPSTLKLFIIIAVSASVCEEILFRGPILAGVRSKFDKKSTVIIVGLLFGLFHMDLYRLVSTTVLGMLITYITLSTGSIFNGMLFHLINNGSAVLLDSGDDANLWLSQNSPWYYYPIFIICFIIGIYLIKQEKIE